LLADIMPAPNPEEVAQSKADQLAKQQSAQTEPAKQDEQLSQVTQPPAPPHPLLLKE
jgi:hypothetical protein